MTTVALAEAKARLSELIKMVRRGESVSITLRGRPVARIVAEEPAKTKIDVDAMRRARAMTKPYFDPDGLSFVERLKLNDEL